MVLAIAIHRKSVLNFESYQNCGESWNELASIEFASVKFVSVKNRFEVTFFKYL